MGPVLIFEQSNCAHIPHILSHESEKRRIESTNQFTLEGTILCKDLLTGITRGIY